MPVKKAELHVHLEGTIRPQLARQLAHRNGLIIPDGLISADEQRYLSRDFIHFLSVYDTLAALIKCPQDYYDITFDYLRENAKEDTIYVEMMYSPDHAELVSGIPSIEHLQAIQHAINDAESAFGIVGRIIITAVRHFGEDAAIRVAEAAAKQSIPAATGFGLGGDEANFSPKRFKRAYEIAAAAGFLCTVHAGEFMPASGMEEAMDHLPIRRIGHGVMSIHSPETRARVKDLNIALEVCPSSNVVLGLFPDIQHHPFATFFEEGLCISLNSDDPPFFGTSLPEEYRRVQAIYHYTDEQMEAITAMAIDAAFVDETTRRALHARLREPSCVD